MKNTMKKKLLGIGFLCLFGFGGVGQLNADMRFHGVSYTSFNKNAWMTENSYQSLLDIKNSGMDTVSLNFFWFQDNVNSSVISADYTRYSASKASVINAIQQSKSLGLKVILKPNVDLRDGNWRGHINASNTWFEGYKSFMNEWADVAESENVDVLCIGNEFSKTESWKNSWQSVASEVRGRYSGSITYGANWDHYKQVKWWDAVDYVGMSAYFPLATDPNANKDVMSAKWNSLAADMKSWKDSKGLDQQIMFTEAGYRSGDGAITAPYDFTMPLVEDLQEQADAYDALLGTMWDKDWWAGSMFWNWETDPNAGGSGTGFTPQGKPALEVLKYYASIPEPSSMMVAGIMLSGLIRVRRS
ncbi:hypothetical protein JD969_18765 [Planctomycetota bacterium]|nr:hypothetical protein JD969_18765 [Planctomycetota bacterium]